MPKSNLDILVLCKLTQSKFQSKIKPLIRFNKIEKLRIIRNRKGFTSNKLDYHLVNHKLTLIAYFSMIFTALKIIKNKNIKMIIGIYHYPYGILASLISKISGIPFIVVTMGSDVNVVCAKYPALYRFLSISNGVIVRGQSSRKLLIEKGLKSTKISNIANFLDMNKFKPISIQKKYDLIYVGDLKKVKRVERILHLSKLLKKFKSELRVAIVGSGSLNKKLQFFSEKLELSKNVDFLGQQEDVSSFLQQSRALIMTSESEGLPQSILEALACGLPIISTNVGDISDIIKDRFNGVLINDFSDRNHFFEILSILEDSERYNFYSNNARKSVKKYYSSNNLATWDSVLGSYT